MEKTVELRELLDIYEKEEILNSKLNIRRENVQDYEANIHTNIADNVKLNNNTMTYERGSDILKKKIIFNEYWIKQMYTAHRILIPILIAIIIFVLFFKVLN